jgi:hypothetical protein
MNYFKTIYNPVNKAQYDKFVNENADAINVLNNLCTDAISRLFRNGVNTVSLLYTLNIMLKDSNGFYYNDKNSDKNTENIAFITKLFREDQLKALRELYKSSGFESRNLDSNLNTEEYEFNLYGDIKTGPRSKMTIEKEIESSRAFSYIDNDDGVSNKLSFDIRSACMVGWDLGSKVNYDDFTEGRTFMFEFSTLLVRFMSNERYLKNKELYDEYIVETLIQKAILFILNHVSFVRVLSNLGLVKLRRGRNFEGPRYVSSNIVNMTKILFVYKTFYDSINECNTSTIIRSLNDMVSYLEIALSRVSETEGITQAYEVISRPQVMYEQHSLRYIDYILRKTIDRVDTLKRSFVLSADMAVYQLNGGVRNLNVLDVALESVQDIAGQLPDEIDIDKSDLINWDEFIKDTETAVDKIVSDDLVDDIIEFSENDIIPVASPAVEGINQQDKDVKYVSVAKLIGKLPQNVAQRYRKLESEAIKLKSDAMNCEDVNTQSVVLRKIASYIRVIGVYRNQYKNDEAFQTLAIALEDQMYDIRNALSDRNFFRERATRLYGIARADFNY